MQTEDDGGGRQRRKRGGGDDHSPQEAKRQRQRTDGKQLQLPAVENAPGIEAGRNAELDDRRNMKAHKSIVRRATAERMKLASAFGSADDGSFYTCIYNQIETSGVKEEFPTITKASDVQKESIKFLRENGHALFSVPKMTDTVDTSQPSATRTASSKNKGKEVSKWLSDRFFENLEEENPAINAVAIFGCCNALAVRIAVLVPGTANRRKWEVWEPLGATGRTCTFYVARVTKNIFESLLEVEEDDEPEQQQELSSDEDNNVEEDLPVAARRQASNGSWVQCVACHKVRYVSGGVSETDKKSWVCDQNNSSSFENQCSDADIWDQINKFWSKSTDKVDVFRTLGGRPLEMSDLFIAVQVVASITPNSTETGSFTALNRHRKATELALKLGGESLQRSSAAFQLKKNYLDIFVMLRSSEAGGGNLEHLLLQQDSVQETIRTRRTWVLKWLNINRDEMALAREPSSEQYLRGVLPVVYQKTAQKQLSTESLHHMLLQFAKAASMFPTHPLLNPLTEIQSDVQDFIKRGGDLKALMLHGNTGVGKSQITDLLLLISEGIDSEYGRNAQPLSSRESKRYIDELVEAEKQMAGGEGTEAGPWSNHVFTVDSKALETFVSKEILSTEYASRHALSSWCEHAEERAANLSDVISYLLPVGDVGKMHGSTTACAVSIVYAETFQVALEYRSVKEILGQWRKWNDLKQQTEPANNLSKKKRDAINKQLKKISAETQRALSSVDPKTVKGIKADKKSAEAFLSQPELDLSQVSELCQVLGSKFALCGAGKSTVQDRIFARRVLHFAQGMPDPTHKFYCNQSARISDGSSASCDSSLLPPFLAFGNDCELLRFGMRTGFALKQLTVFVPCTVAPQRGIEQKGWFDPCGLGDGDVLKAEVYAKSANEADAVLVVVKDSLSRSAATLKELQTTKAMVEQVKEELERPPDAARRPASRVFLAANFELNYNSNAKGLLTLDALSSSEVEESKKDTKQACLEGLGSAATEIARESFFKDEDSEEVTALAQNFTDGAVVPVACPCLFLFASLVLNTNSERLPWRKRLDLLSKTECYPMLGFIENVLQGSQREMVEDLKSSVEKKLAELKDTEKSLQTQSLQHENSLDRDASMQKGKKMGHQEYTKSLATRFKGKQRFKDMDAQFRAAWDDFVTKFGESWAEEWPAKEFVPSSEWGGVVKAFLDDCKEEEVDPFIPSQEGKGRLPDEGENPDFRNLDQYLSLVWTSGRTALCRRLPKAIHQSEFSLQLSETLSSLATECAQELAAQVGATLKEQQLTNMCQAVKDYVKTRIKALTTDVRDFLGSSGSSYSEAFSSLLAEIHGDGTRTEQEKRELLLGKKEKMGKAMEHFITQVQLFFVQRMKSAFLLTPQGAPSGANQLKRQRSRGQGSGTSIRESISTGEECTIGDKFLGMLGLTTQWAKIKKGNHADVSRWICTKVLNEVNPCTLVSRTSETRKQISSAACKLEELLDGLNATLKGWSQSSLDSGDRLVDMGKAMTERFMALRQAEVLANKSGTGVSLLSNSQHRARVDKTGMRHEEIEGGDVGYVPFVYSRDLQKGNSHKWLTLHLKKLERFAGKHDLQKTEWRREDKNQLFHTYGQLLGVEGPAIVKQMRDAVAQMALRDSASDASGSVARVDEIQRVHGSVKEYVEGMQQGRIPGDLVALTYLVDYTGRPLNLYTSWSTNPLRIMPLSLQGQEKEYLEADAFMYLGWEQVFEKPKVGPSDDDEPSSVDGDDADQDETEVTVYHFVRCVSRHDEPQPKSSPSPQSVGWSLDDGVTANSTEEDREQSIEEGWGLLRYRLRRWTNYELKEVNLTGHCQYDAIAHQIRTRLRCEFPDKTGYEWKDVRRDVAAWLRANADLKLENGACVRDFLDEDDGSFEDFCDDVEDKHAKAVWGNHVTLVAAANCYQKTIRVWLTVRTQCCLEIHPKDRPQAESGLCFELGHKAEQHYMSILERYDSVIGLLPCIEELQRMSFEDFTKISKPQARVRAQTAGPDSEHMEVEPGDVEGAAEPASEDDQKEGQLSDGDECMLDAAAGRSPGLRKPEDYRFVTFNPRAWRKSAEDEYTWTYDTGFRLSVDDFIEVASRFSGWTERWCFQRGKEGKNYEALNRRGCTRFFSCDDAIAHTLGCVAVLDGIGENEHHSGSFARLLAKHIADRSFEPVLLQDIADPNYNRSMKLLRLAHKGAVHDYMRELNHASSTARELKSNPGATAVILTLTRQGNGTKLHWLVHGDSQWALLRREGGRYKVKHLSKPTIIDQVQRTVQSRRGRSSVVTLDRPHQICLHDSSFLDQRPQNPRDMTDVIDVEDGDIVIAGTDGFFDNFGDQFARRKQETLESICNFAAKGADKSETKVTEAFGKALIKKCLDFMKNGECKKADDVTLFVGKISLSLLAVEEIRPTAQGTIEPWYSHEQPAASGRTELHAPGSGSN